MPLTSKSLEVERRAIIVGITSALFLTIFLDAIASTDPETCWRYEVDEKNGNLSYSETDIDLNKVASDLKLTRTYNSRTSYSGLFGSRWCSNLETHLEVLPEGNIRILECGSGHEVLYQPRDSHDSEISDLSQKLADELERKHNIPTGEKAQFVIDLEGSASMRSRVASALGIKPHIRTEAALFQNGRGPRVLYVTPDGYRLIEPGRVEKKFDREGRVIEISEGGGAPLSFDYSGSKLNTVTNGLHQLKFIYDGDAVAKIADGEHTLADYSYTAGQLSGVNTHVKSARYTGDNGLLREVRISNSLRLRISYFEAKGMATTVETSDGCTRKYSYPEMGARRSDFTVGIAVNCPATQPVRESKTYQYGIRHGGVSRILVRSLVTAQDREDTEVLYHPLFQVPVRVRIGTATTRYRYDGTGRLAMVIDSNRSVSEFSLDPTCDKISTISTNSSILGIGVAYFAYDSKCNMIATASMTGKITRLVYNPAGMIIGVSDGERFVAIDYESRFGKPRNIERPGVGLIHVSYKSSGEVDRVASESGDSSVAMQVSSVFSNLLDDVNQAENDTESKYSEIGKNCRCSTDVYMFD